VNPDERLLAMADRAMASWKNMRFDAAVCLCAGDLQAIDALGQRHLDVPTFYKVLSDDTRGFDVYKLFGLLDPAFADGDAVVCLDLDALVCRDPFDAFRYDFDLAFTQRAHWHPVYPVNIGAVYLRWNADTRGFLRLWMSEAVRPGFPAYVKFLEQAAQSRTHTRCNDQDFICCLLREAMPLRPKIVLLPPDYNWFPLEDDPDAAAKYRAMRDRAYVLHFKGRFKPLMKEMPP
jgi:hypothetical protein